MNQPRHSYPLTSLGLLLGFMLLVSIAFAPRFAGVDSFYPIMTAGSLILASFAALRLRPNLRSFFVLRPGDLTRGVALALVLLLLSWAGRSLFCAPTTPQAGWLMRLFLQLGPAAELESSLIVLPQILAIVVAEELIFRGAIQSELSKTYGERRGWMLAALSYALALSPTLYQLRVDEAGYNPLLFLAAAAAGILLSFSRRISGRLTPGFIAHIVFSYFALTQFRPPGL